RFSSGCVPDPCSLVEAAARQLLAVGAEPQVPNVALMALPLERRRTSVEGPDADDSILASRSSVLVVRRDIDRPDWTARAGEVVQLARAAEVPGAQQPVIARRQELVAGCECHRGSAADMAKAGHRLPVRCSPDDHFAGGIGRREQGAIAAERDLPARAATQLPCPLKSGDDMWSLGCDFRLAATPAQHDRQQANPKAPHATFSRFPASVSVVYYYSNTVNYRNSGRSLARSLRMVVAAIPPWPMALL